MNGSDEERTRTKAGSGKPAEKVMTGDGSCIRNGGLCYDGK